MSLERWLAEREPAPPPVLAERLHDAVRAHDDGAGEIPERLLAVAEAMVERVLRDGGERRATALDLLAADALVTYAFEAASAEPERLEERATRAMRRIAAMANEPGA